MTSWWCEYAWVGSAPVASVRVVAHSGVVTSVETGVPASDGDERLRGLVLPGFANAHSHAFHRALRGRTHGSGGTFWTWREQMYAVAARLDPDSYLRLARAVYAEMALAGVTCVGEFHYLHHAPGGARYDEPNAMGEALRQAAGDAGIRITLLDACYLSGGLSSDGHLPLDPVQQRFGDGSAEAWASRVGQLAPDATLRLGAAVHSVRAVPRDALPEVASAFPDAPLHVHLSEQQAENDAALAHYGRTPTQLLADAGALGARTTAVHATFSPGIDILGGSGTRICACPTTERDLADGIGPMRLLVTAGSPLCLGSDSHAVIDLLEEARALEMHERLATRRRGSFSPAELVDALTADGHAALGWPEAGRIETAAPADLVAVRLDSVRTAGSTPEQLVLAASSPDVHTVVVGGRTVVRDGAHALGDVGALLCDAVSSLWADA
ncbi:formiminoglutamate deiminase [Motilibacter peucedani]|uniref:Formiminoglutamate deiminase n=1 Tax=Motilibacter peucedani TaxID=598650 RepID=A0A420XQS5_9ACTN|nr:formimidoylglutamate deiminase [Motilibacter peucedani]RKS75661.1 formiminoglutamate deiminase [Motilibacter peucedani]